MRCINVNTPTRNYDVVIADDLINQTGAFVNEFFGVRTAAVISDDIVWSLYGDTVKASLEKSGFAVPSMVFPHGEESKTPSTLIQILEFLASEKLTRSDIIIALGGGVTGDIAGLAASMYLRGIRYVQIPTTVLAEVDSSVGGKCAVDLNGGKNLAGAFWQPSLVLCDYSTLDSLDEKTFADGCAEIIKYGVIGDSKFFNSLNFHVSKQRERVITKCVMMKRDIVSADETDTGVRQLLNFGHTAAHAIEKCSDFKITHGSAVAVGMLTASRYSEKIGVCEEKNISERIEKMLDFYRLPTKCGSFTPEQLCEAALSDKKRSGGTINLVLPKKLGECVLHKINVSELKEFFRS